MTIRLKLATGDKATRYAMRRAHKDGRHGTDAPPDVLAHWATCCADCYWFAYYSEQEREPGHARVFRFAR